MLHKYALWAVLILFITPNDENRIYNEGLKLEKEEKYEEALETWFSAMTVLEEPSFRIGRAYIRLATEHGLSDYYAGASSIYLWGLSGENYGTNRDAIEAELKMLEPLLSKDDYKTLDRLRKKKDARLIGYLRGFWDAHDPTPSTPNYNERLIEHWRRIATARQEFKTDDNTIYGTDDRGSVYVRFGSPDRKYEDRLFLTVGDIENYCKMLECGDMNMVDVFRLHTNTKFELWIYDRPGEKMNHNMNRIFVTGSGSKFREIDVLEELIPKRAYSLGQRYDRAKKDRIMGMAVDDNWMRPAILLTYIYYDRFRTYDALFNSRFMDMDVYMSSMGPDSRKSGSAGQIEKGRSENLTFSDRAAGPKEVSTDKESIPVLDMSYHIYRFLGDDDETRYAVFVGSEPGEALKFDDMVNQDVMFDNESDSSKIRTQSYQLYHGLTIKRPPFEVLAQDRVVVPLNFDEGLDNDGWAYFMIPEVEDVEIQAYAELHNRNAKSLLFKETSYPGSIRGLGSILLDMPDPLKVRRKDLLISDLMLGYDLNWENSDSPFPFNVRHDRVIPPDTDLVLYFELYNVSSENKFNVELSVSSKRGLLNLGGDDENNSTLSIDLRSVDGVYKDPIQIQTRALEAGDYTLNLRFRDEAAGEEISRKLSFSVSD